jgi:hypothetical protein
MAFSQSPKVKLQIPPLRCAPVGMTSSRAAAYIGMSGGGWTESTTRVSTLTQTAHLCFRSITDQRANLDEYG